MFILCVCWIISGSQTNCCFPCNLTSPKTIDYNSNNTQGSLWQQTNAAEYDSVSMVMAKDALLILLWNRIWYLILNFWSMVQL